MRQQDIERINLNGVELRYSSKPKQRSLSKQLITTGLHDSGMLKNPNTADQLVEYLYSLKKTNERVDTLERGKSKTRRN